MQYITHEIARPRGLIDIPFVFAHPLGTLLEWGFKLNPLMDSPLTEDQVTLLHKDNVVSSGAKTFADLGVTELESVEAIVPNYLWRFRPYGQFQTKQNPA